ncbi:MAG: hypothetical protein H6838_11475 [Planctomycetes bacterium]|nr:hypothetical protein [Planctomycetota bacterium]MCB9886105.1 hypothetical protein [Planctomycetota bacterium]
MNQPQPIRDDVDGVSWEARPEWLAGRYWWRVYVARHPKVLLRYRDSAVAVAEAIAADEAQFRRDAQAAE